MIFLCSPAEEFVRIQPPKKPTMDRNWNIVVSRAKAEMNIEPACILRPAVARAEGRDLGAAGRRAEIDQFLSRL